MTSASDVLIAATDFSEPAGLATERAAALARGLGWHLRLLHALGDGDWIERMAQGLKGEFSIELARRTAGSRLSRERERLLEAGVADVDYEVLDGTLPALLPQLLHEGERGVVVMGAQGETGLRQGLLGSTADRVLRAGALPVLLARQGGGQAYRRVALATDLGEPSLHAARLGLRLAPGADFHLLHAIEIPPDRNMAFAHARPETREAFHREARELALRRLQVFESALGLAVAPTRAVREGPPAAVLAAFVEEAQIDLVVLGSRPRARWEANLLGSTALFATHRLPCDVLLVPGVA
ncbi:MAG: hypothetical protein ABS41_10880 [Arenimonas sp. SCN 70-307]|uniref:universal stress protein n=1 Tax=Arenimonas sp. SCN 70-307 TaxID=1660089 RepID=UPI000868C446|nr:universal stress protein [Arenimonas sp. SCN 70-307]ODS62174.1 MAG: hypothetical protein ABS41_10880 [Arenimonas sp. SCN 70-307]